MALFLGVPTYTLDYEMIVVMPDAGNSFYVNWPQTDENRVNAGGPIYGVEFANDKLV